jgi:hypothetical protein
MMSKVQIRRIPIVTVHKRECRCARGWVNEYGCDGAAIVRGDDVLVGYNCSARRHDSTMYGGCRA